jgi:adenylate cyclase
MSDSEGRQLALQAPGWIHGCLGLQFAFGQRRWWIRARPVLFGTALLLPVLAALGFLSMGRELATMAEAPGWMATVPAASSAAMIAIGRLRDGILTGYFLLIGAVFAARELRAWIERHRRLLVSITYPMRTVEVPRGWTVLEASRGFGIPHLSMCGGQGRCSTCRVRVLDGAAELPPPSAQERNTLERIQAADDVRLACQLRPTSRVVLEPLLDPVSAQVCESQQAGNAVEREVAILFVKVAAWTSPRGIQPSPHDLVYALNRLLAVVGGAIETAGGLHGSYNNEGASATFGSDGDLGDALQRALQAAAAIEHALEALNARLLQELGILAKFTIALHSGPAAIGPVGYGRERARLPVGATVRMARLLRDHAAARGARFAISRAAAQAAGWPVASMSWRPLGIADPAMGDAIEGSLLEHVGRPG